MGSSWSEGASSDGGVVKDGANGVECSSGARVELHLGVCVNTLSGKSKRATTIKVIMLNCDWVEEESAISGHNESIFGRLLTLG